MFVAGILIALCALILLGTPIAVALGVVAIGTMWIAVGPELLAIFVQRLYAGTTSFPLLAIPFFVLAGNLMNTGGMTHRIFNVAHIIVGKIRGGLGHVNVLASMLFAGMSGSAVADAAGLGVVEVKAMKEAGYTPRFAATLTAVSSTIGPIIPPSIPFVIYGSLANVSVGDLLVGMVFPGLIMSGCYLAYIYLLCRIRPDAGPVVPAEEDTMTLAEKLRITLFALVPPMFMIIAVLGSLMLGLAAPTEAAAIGAAGSVLLAAFYGRLSWATLNGAVMKTLQVTAMIMTILLAGSMMTGVFIGAGGVTLAQELVDKAQLGPWGLLALVLGLTFLAGFFLDWISIVLIMIPLFTPLIVAAGFDAVWFCILFLVMIQTSYLTPPMAPAIFYLRGIAPPEITTGHMYRGVLPFIGLQVLTLIIVLAFPQTVLWLPSKLLGFN